jgi:hypothetical protein
MRRLMTYLHAHVAGIIDLILILVFFILLAIRIKWLNACSYTSIKNRSNWLTTYQFCGTTNRVIRFLI